MKISKIKIVTSAVIAFLFGCSDKFLDVKTVANQQLLSTIQDYQGLLDNPLSLMNGNQSYALALLGAEEYYVSYPVWSSVPYSNIVEKNAYIWDDDLYMERPGTDWNRAYTAVLTANIALEGLDRLTPSEQERLQWENAVGCAYFFRAYNFYQLTRLFGAPYRAATADSDLGIPLRLESDITLLSRRHSIQETYQQIVGDLNRALTRLPDKGHYKMRPSKSSAHFLLARVYLSMGKYDLARDHAEAFLAINSNLIDFNGLNLNAQFTFPMDYGASNPEVEFYSYSASSLLMGIRDINISEELLEAYDDADLRRQAYFGPSPLGNLFFRGSFGGSVVYFTGFTTGEALLIRAECDARLGDPSRAISALSELRSKRYISGSEHRIAEQESEGDALRQVLAERRLELAFRGLRWEDLRRLGSDDPYDKEIRRTLNGVEYVLPQGSSRLVWPIPDDVIRLSGMVQNKR